MPAPTTPLSPQILALPQGPIRYLDVGEGRPVVFVHGLLTDHRLWHPLLPHLGPGLRCIMPDWPLGAHRLPMHPGADLSVPGMARLVLDFITTLGLEDVLLVGNDTGGALVQMVCAMQPPCITGMALTTCDACDVFPPPAFTLLTWCGHVPGLAYGCAQALHHVPALQALPFTFGELCDAPLAPALVHDWLLGLRSQAGVRRDARKFLRTVSAQHTLKAEQALRGFAHPALLIWSTRSRHFPPRLATRLAAALPHAQLVWVDSAGVFNSLDQPALVARHLRRLALARNQARVLG